MCNTLEMMLPVLDLSSWTWCLSGERISTKRHAKLLTTPESELLADRPYYLVAVWYMLLIPGTTVIHPQAAPAQTKLVSTYLLAYRNSNL